jgi:hypothetical protein
VAKYTGNRALATFKLGKGQLDFLDQLRLDDLVYEAYSRNLIPRAVGYSAAVLNYFFRGNLSILRQEFVVDEDVDKTLIEIGIFNVDVEMPLALGFEGTVSYYFDRIDGERVFVDQHVWNGKNPVRYWGGSDFEGLFILKPVRWHMIFEGRMGPGVQEARAIVAVTGLAKWVIIHHPI